MATKKIAKNIKFEDALSELEAQVQLLESGELPLDKALEVFKYGVELSRVCSSRLETARKLRRVVLQLRFVGRAGVGRRNTRKGVSLSTTTISEHGISHQMQHILTSWGE